MGIRELMEGEVAPSEEDVAFIANGRRDVAFYKNRGYPDTYQISRTTFEAISDKGTIVKVDVTLTLAEYPTKALALQRGYEVLEAVGLRPLKVLDYKTEIHVGL